MSLLVSELHCIFSPNARKSAKKQVDVWPYLRGPAPWHALRQAKTCNKGLSRTNRVNTSIINNIVNILDTMFAMRIDGLKLVHVA